MCSENGWTVTNEARWLEAMHDPFNELDNAVFCYRANIIREPNAIFTLAF